jgi:hypothetical protein
MTKTFALLIAALVVLALAARPITEMANAVTPLVIMSVVLYLAVRLVNAYLNRW